MKTRRRGFLSVALACGLTACAGTRYYVDVNGLRDPRAEGKASYVLFPGMQGTEPTDLQFKEFAGYVETALRAGGYVPAAQASQADLAIFLSYGIGKPRTTYYTYYASTFRQKGGATSTFTAAPLDSGGYSNTTGTVTSPSGGVGGGRSGVGSVTSFSRWAAVEALDVKAFVAAKQLVPVWRTTITSVGSSSDLHRVFPIMIAAGQPFLGSNTGKQVRRLLYEGSREVLAVKGQK